MLTAIDLDDELLLAAGEIADVVSNRDLPRELVAIDLTIAEALPKSGFCIRLIGAQSSRESDGYFLAATHCPAPHPEATRCVASDLSPQKSGERLENSYAARVFSTVAAEA